MRPSNDCFNWEWWGTYWHHKKQQDLEHWRALLDSDPSIPMIFVKSFLQEVIPIECPKNSYVLWLLSSLEGTEYTMNLMSKKFGEIWLRGDSKFDFFVFDDRFVHMKIRTNLTGKKIKSWKKWCIFRHNTFYKDIIPPLERVWCIW